MITVFNERELFITMSVEKQTQITEALNTLGIEYLLVAESTGTSGADNLGMNLCYKIYVKNKDYEKAADIIIETAEKTGVILEFNANGLRRGKKAYPDGERWQYPHERFWEKVKNAGLCAIVGSDAHSPDLIWDKAVSDSIDILRNSGIERITVLKL